MYSLLMVQQHLGSLQNIVDAYFGIETSNRESLQDVADLHFSVERRESGSAAPREGSEGGLGKRGICHVYIYIYIYICIEREMCVYIYIYIHTMCILCVSLFPSGQRTAAGSPSRAPAAASRTSMASYCNYAVEKEIHIYIYIHMYILYYAILYCTILCYTALYCTVPYHTTPYHTILY